MERISWDDYFSKIALVTAERSPCTRLHVGCVIVNNNRIISQGYNGFLPGSEHRSIIENGHEIATVHAEQNAVSFCARRGISCDNSEIYITHYPCINCFKIISAAGIKTIKYINNYKNDKNVKILADIANVTIIKLNGS